VAKPQGSGPRPTVYATLGTVFNVESGDLFARVLAGLADLPVSVVATVGPQIDPDEFAPHPPNTRIERGIEQDTLLPDCDLVISHAGSGTVLGALAHGLPMILLPMGADQPANARRCEALGVARVLDPVSLTPVALRQAVAEVMARPNYRLSARRIAAEIAALPDPAASVPLLEALATQRA
jgi:MGT family glycosyltransferase